MPSGRTHDSITLWSLPLVAGLTFSQTQSSSLTLMLSGGYLFSGLMFGPDLDIYSRQYRRWGWLRWIWLPYQRSMRHRSILSHGPIVGTIVRVFYLALCLGIALSGAVVVGAIIAQLLGLGEAWRLLMQQSLNSGQEVIGRSLQQNTAEWVALLLGLEAGAMSHALSDWGEFAYKRLQKKRLPVKAPQSRPTRTIAPPPTRTFDDIQLPPFLTPPPHSPPSVPTSPPPPSPPTSSPLSPPPRRRFLQLPDFKRPPRD